MGNVDGCIAACFVDVLRSSGAFTFEEIDELVDHGCLNGLFVLARTAGFIGHYLDQKRLKQPLYRHPWDDITYIQELAGIGCSAVVAQVFSSTQACASAWAQAPRRVGAEMPLLEAISIQSGPVLLVRA